jgi:hypothetical protein
MPLSEAARVTPPPPQPRSGPGRPGDHMIMISESGGLDSDVESESPLLSLLDTSGCHGDHNLKAQTRITGIQGPGPGRPGEYYRWTQPESVHRWASESDRDVTSHGRIVSESHDSLSHRDVSRTGDRPGPRRRPTVTRMTNMTRDDSESDEDHNHPRHY